MTTAKQQEAVQQFINYCAKKERIEYYMDLFKVGMKEALIKDYGETMFGMSDGYKRVACNKQYVLIQTGEEYNTYGWDWITAKVKEKLDNKVEEEPIQLSLFEL